MARTRFVVLAAAVIAVAASSAHATAMTDDTQCFDALVTAKIVRQTPTVAPDCADCLIMRWPWILELDVQRVDEGDIAPGPLTVVSLQHTYFRDLPRWWLRRNSAGVYNVLEPATAKLLQRCSADAPPARAFIRPADGSSLEDLRREGEARYGPDPTTTRPRPPKPPRHEGDR